MRDNGAKMDDLTEKVDKGQANDDEKKELDDLTRQFNAGKQLAEDGKQRALLFSSRRKRGADK